MKNFVEQILKRDKPTATASSNDARSLISDERYPTTKSGQILLSTDERIRCIGQIKRCVSVTNEYWTDNYVFALHQFAELVQEHPASRSHHHSQPGGLLDHTLDVVLRALRLSAGVILPPNSEPEEILHNAERWRFGIFITSLLHDIGKLVCDQETVYRDTNGMFVCWLPWHGAMPTGREYACRYRETRGEHIHGLHETAGITLLPYVLTPTMSRWITADRTLLGQIMHTLSASATGAGVVGEIIRKADQNSTANNLGPTTGLDDSTRMPLHAKILAALQTLANEGKIKRNMPGSGVWVGESYSWFVAKSTMEKVRDHLLSAGHSGIPQSPLRLMQILNEHKLTKTPSHGDVQQGIVKDTQRDWEQKLSFLVFPNETIWISGTPNRFKGEVIPVDDEGNLISLSNEKQSTHETEMVESQGVTELPPVEPDSPKILKTRNTAPKTKVQQSNLTKSLCTKHDMFVWLLNGIKYRRIKINESGAPVHVLEGYVALITPRIFDLYLDDNKAVALSMGKDRQQQLNKLQRDLRELKLHSKPQNGDDFHKIIIRGPRKESTIHGLILPIGLLPELSNLSVNPMLGFAITD